MEIWPIVIDRVASSDSRSACRSVTLVSRAKMAEAMELPFVFRTQMGPGNHVSVRVHIRHGSGQF